MSLSDQIRGLGSRPCCWLSLILLGAGPVEAGFQVRDLGVLVAGGSSGATGINSSGATSGTFIGATSMAVQATGGGTFGAISVARLPGVTASSAAAISDSGQVAGQYHDGLDGKTHAFVASGRVATDLLGGDARFQGASSQGVAINSAGIVAGNAQLRGGAQAVFTASAGGSATLITLPGGSQTGSAGGINSQGTVVGSYINSVGLSRVFLAMGGVATDVVPRNSAMGFGLNAYGVAINRDGAIAGYADFGGTSHAFFVSATGTQVDIGTTGGFNTSRAAGLNNLGQVVGTLSTNGSGSHAFLWDGTAGLFDLNNLLDASARSSWVLTVATGINDQDQISGQGYFNGQLHGFALTRVSGSEVFFPAISVPEPPSAWLAVAALGFVGGWARIRRGRTPGRATA